MRSRILVATLLVLVGCQPSSPKVPPQTPEKVEPTDLPGAVAPQARGAGDAEAETLVELTVTPDPAQTNIKVTAENNAKKDLAICSVKVAPPFPKELWANVRIAVKADYSAQPVVLRGTLRRDGQAIEAIHTIATGRKPLEVGGAVWPLEFKFDVLKGLTQIPESMLLDVMLTAEVTPPGTDAAQLDPGKPPAPDASIGNTMSNPLRIDFETAGPLQ